MLSWEAPSDNSRVNYYQYQLYYGVTSTIAAYNTSNTSATVSGIPYNENLTLLIIVHNCIGSSAPYVAQVSIGKVVRIDGF